MEEDSLKTFWNYFFKAETGTYEKSTWLDLFLAEFLIRIDDGADPKDLIKFCPVSGVVSLVGCELLCGLHRVTSSVEQRLPVAASEQLSEDLENEDLPIHQTSLFSRANAQSSAEILRQYLLSGVPWRCLVLLRTLGVEGLSCCRQLSAVLIWVFGELSAGATTTTRPAPATSPRTPIHLLFSHGIWSKKKMSQEIKTNSVGSEKSSLTGRSRRTSQNKTDSTESKSNRKQSKQEQSSESGDSNDDLQILNKSLTVKVCSPPDDFKYFDSPVRTSNEYSNETLYYDPYYVPLKPKPKAEDYMTNKHKVIMNSEITAFEFTLLITDLLQELCKTESSLSGSEGSQISVQCINFSLKNLCSLQFGSMPSQSVQYSDEEVSRIKVALTELLIVSLDKVLVHSVLCTKLINNGILPMLLRILEDVICKSTTKYNTKEDHNRDRNTETKLTNKTESENLLKFVFGIAYSITAFFHCLLMQCRTIDKLREFTDQFKLYGECLKGGLLKECIEMMVRIPGVDKDIALLLVKKLIESIGRLISGMKRIRSEVVHSAACPRSKHKACKQRLAAGMHHHHDILGEAGTGLPLASACCISILYGTLTSLVTDEEYSAQTVLRTKLLRVMLNSGACCCFSPGFLMESIVRLMLTHNSVATLCLLLLEHSVYGELGASVLLPKTTDQLPCSVCEPVDDKREMVRKYCPHGAVDRKSVWSFLIHYNSLLQLDNHNNVLHATVSHLLRVTPKCRTDMKYELLFSVIYPTFIVAKHRYILRMEESAYFLTVSCLNIFASLLNTVSFAEQFIQKGGLSYVLELVSLTEFSNQCCSILEIAIIVEIFKLMKENTDLTYHREVGSLSSVQMLFKSLSDMTVKCYKIYKLKLDGDKFDELCDVTKEQESLAFDPIHTGPIRKPSMPLVIKSPFATESTLEDTVADYVEVLKNIWTFWKTCASLCLYSPMFREYIVSESVFLDSYAMLKVMLYYLCNCECAAAEMRGVIKILEALLTTQFAVSDVTSGRSKATSCVLVRAALATPAALLADGGAGGSGLRALCEALIRVCRAQPSRLHAMPRAHMPKVPPLGCTSGSSSADCSSSEESATAPYGSDRSEPARPDEGYEADVEIGKLELLSHKTRKIASNIGYQSPSMEAIGVDCAEYNKNGDLAHPELCVIVVDILTQLIQKVVSTPDLPTSASGAALARAWCSRLAAALRSARAAPSPLLRRLLHHNLLHTTSDHLHDLQRSILELIEVLAAQSIEPPELASFLRLFASPTPPLGLLLNTLWRLVSSSAPSTPDAILTFPVDTDNKEDNEHPQDLHYVVITGGAASQSTIAENAAAKLRGAHLRIGVKSPWSCGAVRCSIEGTGWAPWLQGFSLALWLRTAPQTTEKHDSDEWETADEWQAGNGEPDEPKKTARKEQPAKTTELVHVVSVGHDSLMFEVWLDVDTGYFTFRLSRPDPQSNKIVSEARIESGVTGHAWSCVSINVRDTVRARRTHVQVTLFVNGCECETIALPLQGILVRKPMPMTIVIGHGTRGGYGAVYHMSHVSLHRTPALSAYSALHLAAHGPDHAHACQVRCDSPNFPVVLTPNVLDSDVDWDQVFESSGANMRELHDNLLLTFSAHAPTIMNLYHQTVALPTVFSGRVGSTTGLTAGGPGPAIPEALFPVWEGGALASRHRGLPPALFMLGGPDVLLYLFARVVELEGTAEEQAMALSILLRVCRVDNRLYAVLYGEDSLDMLHTVFAASKCKVTHHLVKAILDEACSCPVVSWSGNTVLVLSRSDAALLEPRLIVLLTRAWRQLDAVQEVTWEEEGVNNTRVSNQSTLWALTLRCIRVLVRKGGWQWETEHPRRPFNHDQLSRVGLLRHLLQACKERFLNSECGPLDPIASENLVELVRALMADPPHLDTLALLADFLLLMHQASDTFLTHSRANFYFLLSADAAPPPPRARSARHPASDDNDVKSSSENKTSQSEKGRTSQSDDVKSSSEKDAKDRKSSELLDSGDSTKHLKGMINTKLKEARKHNTPSTSENSDATVDKSSATTAMLAGENAGTNDNAVALTGTEPGRDGDGTEGDKGEELNEYIVIDVEDMKPTTAEMYASGMYQQSRVRAGAEPDWSACEGLLLLLRDAIAALPPHDLAQAVCSAVQAENIVVLANHRGAGVRAALLRVVAALQRRAPADWTKKLRQQHYYIHLANQISLYPASWELAEAAAALLTKCDVPLEDQLDDDIWLEMSSECIQRSPPLLAILPCCLHLVPLAHNVTLILRLIIDKASLKVLNEINLAEVVVRCVTALGQSLDFEGRSLLWDDLCTLLNRLAVKALCSPHNMATISDLHDMLSYMELTSSKSTEGEENGSARAARDAQISLFTAQLDYLEERLQSSYAAHTKYANYFTTVLSSAVSLGAEAAARNERTELAARHLSTVSKAVAFVVARSPELPTEWEAPLVHRLFATLLPAVGGTTQRPKWWVSGGADWVTPLQTLFWWSCAPAGGVRALQPRLLRALYLAPPHAVQPLADPDPSTQRKLAVYLLTILKNIHAEAESGTPPVERAITDWARGWAVSTQAGLPDRLPSGALADEAARLMAVDDKRWSRAASKQRASVYKVVYNKDAFANKLTEGAMGITRQVVDVQNSERKAFMEHLRRTHSDASARSQRWARLVDTFTHDQALWHDPTSYPASWQLDPTEGPGRVRLRLRRAHLNIHPRFFKTNCQYKAERIRRQPPLRSVIGPGGGCRGLTARLQLHECVAHMARGTYVTVCSETRGELLLTDRCIHFVPEDSESEDQLSPEMSGSQSWSLDTVLQVTARRWCLQETAVELFLSSGRAHLLAFDDQEDRTAFLKALYNCHLPARTDQDTLAEAMAQWRNGNITNWEYLMRLNGLAGRSYNDLMQYPVLPFVIADYTSRILDLTAPTSFRDLSRPMAIQNKAREVHYINTYNDLKVARREGCSPLLSRQPHHYASLYSNSGGVLHYLVRLPPFTELFLKYQDNNFDMPDRTFHSLATTWRLITNDSPTDVKELIPELFYLPELLHNNEGLNLGMRQCGAAVDDVELPAWAMDARLFMLIHRQALESPLVTERLPQWLDLVFGFKQTGQAAIDAINVFPACTYYGFDPSSLEDEVDRTAAAAMVRTYGQAPRQLLKQPHPQRAPDLVPLADQQPEVWAGVIGARWGRYCGSPALGTVCVATRKGSPGATSLHALPKARTAAITTRATVLVALTGETATNQNGYQGSLALLSWDHSDSIVRLKRRRDARPDLLMHVPALDQITKVSSCVTGGHASPVIIGHASGRVLAVRVRPPAPGAPPRARQRQLHAHSATITDIHVCARAALLVTASEDGKIVLWDLNELTYIRTLPNRGMIPVTHVAISETLCDVASVHDATRQNHSDPDPLAADHNDPLTVGHNDPNAELDSDSYEKDSTYKYESLIRVHTVNARFVGSVKVSSRVTCVCYSNAAEGVSVNCVVAGLDSGGARLYCAWDLRPVAVVAPAQQAPLISLTYSSDASILFGCYADGTAVAWESSDGSGSRTAPIRLLPAHALF